MMRSANITAAPPEQMWAVINSVVAVKLLKLNSQFARTYNVNALVVNLLQPAVSKRK